MPTADEFIQRLSHAAYTDWVREQLLRFRYKEGWRFAVVEWGLFGSAVWVGFQAKDTYDPDGPTVEVGKATPMFAVPTGDPDMFARWLAHEVQDMEIHESREWLRRDGAIYDDPHKATT